MDDDTCVTYISIDFIVAFIHTVRFWILKILYKHVS
jgi:hypothetical protein